MRNADLSHARVVSLTRSKGCVGSKITVHTNRGVHVCVLALVPDGRVESELYFHLDRPRTERRVLSRNSCRRAMGGVFPMFDCHCVSMRAWYRKEPPHGAY